MQKALQELRPGFVHIWCVDLDRSGLDAASYRRVLSPAERQDGRAVAIDIGRDRYFARKAFCRLVLARYLGAAPERILFSSGALGKPGFSPGLRSAGLQFSASSSGPLAVLAVARGMSVGVDIETVRPSAGLAGVADWLDESFAHAGDDPDADDDVAFFRRWTRLEARAKCAGDGLALHEARDGAGWNFWTTRYDRGRERFVLTLATRQAPLRVEGPFMFSPSSIGHAWMAAPPAHAALPALTGA